MDNPFEVAADLENSRHPDEFDSACDVHGVAHCRWCEGADSNTDTKTYIARWKDKEVSVESVWPIGAKRKAFPLLAAMFNEANKPYSSDYIDVLLASSIPTPTLNCSGCGVLWTGNRPHAASCSVMMEAAERDRTNNE